MTAILAHGIVSTARLLLSQCQKSNFIQPSRLYFNCSKQVKPPLPVSILKPLKPLETERLQDSILPKRLKRIIEQLLKIQKYSNLFKAYSI